MIQQQICVRNGIIKTIHTHLFMYVYRILLLALLSTIQILDTTIPLRVKALTLKTQIRLENLNYCSKTERRINSQVHH